MIKITNTEVYGWEAAIRGMRNPMNSWDKSDSIFDVCCDMYEEDCHGCPGYENDDLCDKIPTYGNYTDIGSNDLTLMKKLGNAGPDHGKFLRMITVTADVCSHHVWWAEFDTYKIGTVRNSCSKMHKIHVKEFEKEDFTTEGIDSLNDSYVYECFYNVLDILETLRIKFNGTKDKRYWRALIELLPMGYNIKATVQLNYQVLKSMYHARKNHKLDEWRDFCAWIKTLPTRWPTWN